MIIREHRPVGAGSRVKYNKLRDNTAASKEASKADRHLETSVKEPLQPYQ